MSCALDTTHGACVYDLTYVCYWCFNKAQCVAAVDTATCDVKNCPQFVTLSQCSHVSGCFWNATGSECTFAGSSGPSTSDAINANLVIGCMLGIASIMILAVGITLLRCRRTSSPIHRWWLCRRCSDYSDDDDYGGDDDEENPTSAASTNAAVALRPDLYDDAIARS